jgi:hypothetical protein
MSTKEVKKSTRITGHVTPSFKEKFSMKLIELSFHNKKHISESHLVSAIVSDCIKNLSNDDILKIYNDFS